MSVAAVTTERRNEPRYASPRSADLTIRRNDATATIPGELIDLSAGGAKIKLNTALRFSEVIRLSISTPELGAETQVGAMVCWGRPTEDDQWLVGCSLDRKLPAEVLHELAAGGMIERRQHPRYPCRIPAMAQWELEALAFPTEIRNYSIGGFCIAIASPRPSRIGAAVRVQVDAADLQDTSTEGLAFCGTVCWQAEQANEFLLGCMLRDDNPAELFRQLKRLSDWRI